MTSEPIATPDRAVTDAAAGAVALAQGRKRIERWTLSTGVVLRFRPVPPVFLDRARQAVPVPQVPRTYIEAKGVEVLNPNHPDYIAALRLYDEQLVLAAWRAAAMLGTEVESLPDGFPGPEDDRWIEQLEAALPEGEELDVQREVTNERQRNARYYDWLRLYAFGSEEDAFTVSADRDLDRVADRGGGDDVRRLVSGFAGTAYQSRAPACRTVSRRGSPIRARRRGW